MDDRELLEMAAKAAGIEGLDFDYAQREGHGLYFGPRLQPASGIQAMCHRYWRPLEDDGDALRLALSCPGLDLKWVITEAWQAADDEAERAAYVRRAITETLARIGQAMQEQH